MKLHFDKIKAALSECCVRMSMFRLMTFGCDSKIPERNIAMGYMFYIVLGCVLLCLPWANTDASTATFIDHLFRRIVIKLCLGVDVAKSEDEEFSVVDAVEFSPESLDFRVY